MDPRTRTYALVGGEDYRRRPLDAAWALERFPAQRVGADAAHPVAGGRDRIAHGDHGERRRAEERAEEVRRRIAEHVREPAAERRPDQRAGGPGGVHDAERQSLSEPGTLGAVGDERHPGRVEAAEGQRPGDREQGDRRRRVGEGEQDPDDDRRAERPADGEEPAAAVGEPAEQRVQRRLDQAGDEEDGADRDGSVAAGVERERGEHVEHAEEQCR